MSFRDISVFCKDFMSLKEVSIIMDNNSAWEKFKKSGSVIDYLKYKFGTEILPPTFTKDKYEDFQGEKNARRNKGHNC